MIIGVAVQHKITKETMFMEKPFRHYDVWERLKEMNVNWKWSETVEGFMTDDGKFLNRVDAMKEALKSNIQLIDFFGDLDKETELFSENLW